MPPLNYDRMIREVEAGLPCARQYLDDARIAQAVYDYDAQRYGYLFAREAENPADQAARPYRPSGFAREIVEILTEHLYCPGPSRTWSDPAGQELLQRVYADNDIQGLMADADELSTLNDCAAIQVDAAAGSFAARPLTLRLWGREQYHVWTDPNDALAPSAVVTIDQYDETTRYRLWTAEEVRTYESAKGSVTSRETGREPNTYGIIPFAFVHYKRPIRRFFEPGLSDLIVQAELRINDRLSQLDETVKKHLNPIPIATDVPADWQPIVEPMRFIRLRSAGGIGASGGYDPGRAPTLQFLQASPDVGAAWNDVREYCDVVLEAARVPRAAARMEQAGIASGIQIIVEQAPLLTRARRRRGPFARYETELARVILTCAGNHYGRPQYVASAASGTLALAWPQPSVPIPTQDRLELLQAEVRVGLKSYLMSVEEWYGVDRAQAIHIVQQIEADQAALAAIAPGLAESHARPEADDRQDQDAGRGSGSDRGTDDDDEHEDTEDDET